MNIITKFIEKLLYYSKKTIISTEDTPNSTIVAYNLSVADQMVLATATLSVLLKENTKRNNLSYKQKEDLVIHIVKILCGNVGVDININSKED